MKSFSALLAMAAAPSALAFAPSSTVRIQRSLQVQQVRISSARSAATLDSPTTTTNNEKTTPSANGEATTWECNDDAECVEVPACDDEGCRTSLDVRIHGEWYDLTGKRAKKVLRMFFVFLL